MESNIYNKQKSRRKILIKYQIIIIVGYAITQVVTLIGKELGFTSISYEEILFIALTSTILTFLVMVLCLSFKNLSNNFLQIIELLQYTLWLIIYIFWIYFLHEARIIGLFFSFCL